MFRKMEIRTEESESQIATLGVRKLKGKATPAKFNALENILREREIHAKFFSFARRKEERLYIARLKNTKTSLQLHSSENLGCHRILKIFEIEVEYILC